MQRLIKMSEWTVSYNQLLFALFMPIDKELYFAKEKKKILPCQRGKCQKRSVFLWKMAPS